VAAAKQTLRFYQNSRVSTEVKDALTHSVFRHAGGLLAQRASVADEGHLLMGVSNTDTVMTELGHAALKAYPYSPYGHCPARSESNTLLAFNGEPLDLATGCYALGNGYRLYNPTLERFYSPDNLSPFGKGGLNAYMYCAGDPVNRVDPTGHLSFVIMKAVEITATAIGFVGAGLTFAGMFKKSKELQLAGGLLLTMSLTVMSTAQIAIPRMRTINSARSAPLPGDLPPSYEQALNPPEAPPPTYSEATGNSEAGHAAAAQALNSNAGTSSGPVNNNGRTSVFATQISMGNVRQ
jgi:RHS repeat-associated protein